MQPRFVYLFLAGITIFGAYLRGFELGVPSLWLDEILHLQITRSIDWSKPLGLLFGLEGADRYSENGSLYYLLQALGQRLAPGDLGVRVPSAVVGSLTVPLFALVAGRFTEPRNRAAVTLAAGFALAVAPLHVYYSREGRPYYLLMLLAVCLLGALARSLDQRKLRPIEIGGLTVLCVLGAYIGLHSVPILGAAAAVAASLAGLRLIGARFSGARGQPQNAGVLNLLVLLGILGAALVLCAGLYLSRSRVNVPTLELRAEQQAIVDAPVFESPLSERSLRRFASSMTTAGHVSSHVGERALLFFALAIVGLVAPLLRSPRLRPRGAGGSEPALGSLTLTALGMFVIPATGSLLALLVTGRWFHVRYTAAALPAFLLLCCLGLVAAARLISDLGSKRWSARSMAVVFAGLIVSAVAVVMAPNRGPALDDPHRKLDWRAIAEFVDEMVLPGEPIVTPTDWAIVCLGHYMEQRGRQLDFVKIWESSEQGQEAVDANPRGWLLTVGMRKTNEVRGWMFDFVPVLRRSAEEFSLFYFPSLADLMETRFAAGRGEIFEQRFEDWGRRFEFAGGELTLQGTGWSFVERSADLNFQWATGDEARLGVPIGTPRDLDIEFRALPFDYPNAPPQVVEIWLGEHQLEIVQLEPGWQEVRVHVPEEIWAAQLPVLRLRFAHSTRPTEVMEGSADRRELAMAVDWLRVAERAND